MSDTRTSRLDAAHAAALALLADEAGGAMTDAQRLELCETLQALPSTERADVLRFVAACELACVTEGAPGASESAMPKNSENDVPEHLRHKLLEQARAAMMPSEIAPGLKSVTVSASPAPLTLHEPGPSPGSPAYQRRADRGVQGAVPLQSRRPPMIPWLAAAAGISLAAIGWLPRLTNPGGVRADPIATLRAEIDTAKDTTRIAFAPGTGLVEFAGAKGEVVWSTSAQRGYMRLVDVPNNVKSKAQYQLWIIDPARDTKPVDGGVFDISGNDVVVPIDAKLAVVPAGFALTREKPGGVVVSAGPLVMVALAK